MGDPVVDGTDAQAGEAPTARPTEQGWIRQHWFELGVAVALVVGGVVRWLSVVVWRPTCIEDLVAVVESGKAGPGFDPRGDGGSQCLPIWNDAGYHYLQGRLLARGHGFVDGTLWVFSNGTRYAPSAGDPPLYATFIAALAKVGVTSGTGVRLATSVIGLLGVLAVAVVTRRLFGRWAGLLAAAIGAVYPMFWINDGMALSEGIYMPLIAAVILVAYWFWDEPSYATAGALAFVISLAALTRGEAQLLFLCVPIPLLWGLRQVEVGTRLKMFGAMAVIGMALLFPWFGYNLSRFKSPVLMTSGTGAVLSAASCDGAYYGDLVGYYANCYDEFIQKGLVLGKLPGCDEAAVAAAQYDTRAAAVRACFPNIDTMDESERDEFVGRLAREYISAHTGRLPVVMVARVGRAWDLYTPHLGEAEEPLGQNVRLNWQIEGRGKWSSRLGVVAYWAMLPFAVGGLVVLVRRRMPVSPLVAMATVITVTSAMSFGITRYRVPIDVVVVVLAAGALGTLLERRWSSGDTGTITPRPARRDRSALADPPPETAAATHA